MADTVLKLKEEGNALFSRKEYSQAIKKYTSALKRGDNALLYSNRAACHIEMGKYLDARSDAKKATRVDPQFVKGWGRLAVSEQNLANWELAISAYEKALGLLSKDSLSTAEIKLKDQYTAGLKLSKDKQSSKGLPALAYAMAQNMKLSGDGEMPWDCARQLTNSSAVDRHSCRYSEFEKGLNQLTLVREEDIGPPSIFTGKQGVLEAFSDSIMMDSRAFSLDLKLIDEKFNDHLIMEMSANEAWTDAGPDLIIEEAQTRLQTLGWESVRPALSTTVRAWIIRAYLSAGIDRDTAVALRFYEGALEILERGRKVWKDVPLRDRGVIFEDTFVRGLRVLLNQEYMNAVTAGIPNYTVEKLLAMAEDLFESTEKARAQCTSKYSPGFFQAFFIYPAADSLATKGYCFKRMAQKQNPESKEVGRTLIQASAFYWQAAQKFPDDDEYCCYYITISLDIWWIFRTVSIKPSLERLEKLKQCYPKMLRIWKNTGMGMPVSERNEPIEKCLDYYETVRRKLRTRELTEKSIYPPEYTCLFHSH